MVFWFCTISSNTLKETPTMSQSPDEIEIFTYMKALDEETLELMSSSSLTDASPSSNKFSPESPAAASSRAASYLSREVASELVEGCKRVLSHPRDGFFYHRSVCDFPVFSCLCLTIIDVIEKPSSGGKGRRQGRSGRATTAIVASGAPPITTRSRRSCSQSSGRARWVAESASRRRSPSIWRVPCRSR